MTNAPAAHLLWLAIAGTTVAASTSCGGRSESELGTHSIGAGGTAGTGDATSTAGTTSNTGANAGRHGGVGGTLGGASGRTAGVGGSSVGGVATDDGGMNGATAGRAGGSVGGGGSGPIGPETSEGGVDRGTAGELGSGGAGSGQGGSGDDACDDELIPTLRVPTDYATIQAAIDAASGAAVIAVAPGTYFENLDFLGKGVALVSTSGPANTIIDGGAKAAVITMESAEPASAIVSGFTIQNGRDYWGAGITLMNASPTIRDNWFLDNYEAVGGFGAAIGGNNASPLVDSNYFRGNWCDDQFLSGVLSFVNDSSPRIVNNIIYDNDCRGIDITAPSNVTPDVANNTLVDNRTGIYVDARVPTAGHTYRNNVVVGGDIGMQVVFLNSGNEPTWTHNLVFGSTTAYDGIADPTGTLGNLAADPRLAAPDLLDFHLGEGSPAIDAGTSQGLPLPRLDYEGHARVVDGNADGAASVDLGAFEFGAALLCPRAR